MFQYKFDTGTTLNIAEIDGFAAINTAILPTEEIRILVDTSVPRTVILPYSALFPVQNVKITIVDVTGDVQTNNITVQAATGSPDDLIAGASSMVINTNYQAVRLEILTANSWRLVNAGGSGGEALLTFDQTFNALQVTNLLNDANAYEVLVAPVASNQIIDVVTANCMVEFNSIPYNNTTDDAHPTLYINSSTLAINPKKEYDTDAIGMLPDAVLNSDLAPLLPQYASIRFDPQIYLKYDNKFTPNGAYNFSGVISGGGLYLRSGNNYNITKGNSPIRVYGSYYIKSL